MALIAAGMFALSAYGAHDAGEANNELNDWMRQYQTKIKAHQLRRAQKALERYKTTFLPAERRAAAQALGGIGSTVTERQLFADDGDPRTRDGTGFYRPMALVNGAVKDNIDKSAGPQYTAGAADISGYIANAEGRANADVMQQARGLTRRPNDIYAARDLTARAASGIGDAGEAERRRIDGVNRSRRVQMLSIGKGLPTQANALTAAAGANVADTAGAVAAANANAAQQYQAGVQAVGTGLSMANNYYSRPQTTTTTDEPLLGPPNV